MYATYVIKTNARSVLTRFTVGGSITDYIDDPAKGPPGEVSKYPIAYLGRMTRWVGVFDNHA